jgi:hypothetical protein
MRRTTSSPAVHPIKGALSRPFLTARKTALSPPSSPVCRSQRCAPADDLPLHDRLNSYAPQPLVSITPAFSLSLSLTSCIELPCLRALAHQASTSLASLHSRLSIVDPVDYHQRSGPHTHENGSCLTNKKSKILE